MLLECVLIFRTFAPNDIFMKLSTASLFVLAMVYLTSCSSEVYQQIATLDSKQVMLKEDGSFIADHGLFTIQYDFWAPSGQVAFWVTNQTDTNLYLDLSESFVVKNGRAYDYYQGRTWVYSGRLSTSAQTSVNVSESVSRISMENGHSVEYTEQPVLCIPAHSSKYIDEFSVSSRPYVECGFPSDPSSKEKVIRVYDSNSSPIVIENRLAFFTGSNEVPVNHVFYVKSLQNISEDDVLKTFRYRENCAGKVIPVPVTVHKLAGANKYYIRYEADYNENYRTANKK